MGKQIWKPGNMLYPLPAVMVSTADKNGSANILTVAWTGTVCTNPAMVYISVRPERYSYHMIQESGEFVINLTTGEQVRATDICGVRSGTMPLNCRMRSARVDLPWSMCAMMQKLRISD